MAVVGVGGTTKKCRFFDPTKSWILFFLGKASFGIRLMRFSEILNSWTNQGKFSGTASRLCATHWAVLSWSSQWQTSGHCDQPRPDNHKIYPTLINHIFYHFYPGLPKNVFFYIFFCFSVFFLVRKKIELESNFDALWRTPGAGLLLRGYWYLINYISNSCCIFLAPKNGILRDYSTHLCLPFVTGTTKKNPKTIFF